MNGGSQFQPIISALESHGRYWSIQPLSDGSERLVCVSARSEYGYLHGNSFWVARRKGTWWLVCWTNAAYCVPDEVDLGQLCIKALELASDPLYALPSNLIDQFKLTRDDDGFGT